MPLTHFSDRKAVQLLATQSRRMDLSPYELSRVHADMGRYIAHELLERLSLEPYEIQHPQGIRSGWRIAQEQEIALVTFMRAGLYVTDGIRDVLRNAAVFHASPTRQIGLASGDLERLMPLVGRTVVLVDSVVNTGATLVPVLHQLAAHRPALVAVVSLVAPVETAGHLERTFPDVHFLFARLSTNQYTGKGSTDTGNRLFGTFHETIGEPTLPLGGE